MFRRDYVRLDRLSIQQESHRSLHVSAIGNDVVLLQPFQHHLARVPETIAVSD